MAPGIDPVIQSYLDFLYSQRRKRWDKIVTYRQYAEGDSNSVMTDDQKILLVGADSNGYPNADPEISINLSSIVLNAEADRLGVRTIRITIPDNDELSEAATKAVWGWWERSGMIDGQEHAYYSAGRDGDSYPIVEYDNGFPGITLNMAYDGTSGTEMAYEDAQPSKPLYAAKRWTVQRPVVNNLSTNRVYRMNLYFNNRIEYYISKGMAAGSRESGWRRLSEGDRDYDAEMMREVVVFDAYDRPYTATVVWLTDDGTETGTPIGNPVKHMRHDGRGNPYGRSRIADIVPGITDATNRASVSLQAAALLSGFKELYVTGFYPTEATDGTSNAIVRSPSAVHYIEDANAAVTQTTETDLNQLIAVLDKFMVVAATLTNTPLSMFNLTAHTPAEGTQKQLEQALVTDVEASQRSYTRVWQEVVRQQLKMDALYNLNSVIPLELFDQIDDFDINVEWESAQTRNEKEEREIAVTDYKELDVPREIVWERFWDAETINRMMTAATATRGAAIGAVAERVLQMETGGDMTAPTTSTNSAFGDLPSTLESDKGLNGAQITAALEILNGVQSGAIADEVAVDLLTALGIEAQRAQRMVSATATNRSRSRITDGANPVSNREPVAVSDRTNGAGT